jgi:hypothetical protein
MHTLGSLEFIFSTNGVNVKKVPQNVKQVNHPRNNAICWLIGESEVYQVGGPAGNLKIGRDNDVVEMINVFK